jgi:hypothetical protein
MLRKDKRVAKFFIATKSQNIKIPLKFCEAWCFCGEKKTIVRNISYLQKIFR